MGRNAKATKLRGTSDIKAKSKQARNKDMMPTEIPRAKIDGKNPSCLTKKVAATMKPKPSLLLTAPAEGT